MGYTTDFIGNLSFDKPVDKNHEEYINQFSNTRRMQRNEALCETRPDPIRKAVGLPVGEQGEFYVGETGFAGQDHGVDVVNYNCPPDSQPGLWCQWIIENNNLIWDGGEKFYNYVEWLEYLINHFFIPWGYTLNGKIYWQGEESTDLGVIIVDHNQITTKVGKITYE